MERVAFLVEATGEHIACLLNPESVTFHRRAGLRPRRDRGEALLGAQGGDDPLVATGGGITEFTLHLLFDSELAETLWPGMRPEPALHAGPPEGERDVRSLTRAFWNLTENAEEAAARPGAPPTVRFIWGRAWNVRCVADAVAERLERFAPDGTPQRSWMTMRLRRVPEGAPGGESPREPVSPQHEFPGELDPSLLEEAHHTEALSDAEGRTATPPFLLAFKHYGTPALWPIIAAASGIDDPLRIEAGTPLVVPPKAAWRAAP
jgi:hypothetical protein